MRTRIVLALAASFLVAAGCGDGTSWSGRRALGTPPHEQWPAVALDDPPIQAAVSSGGDVVLLSTGVGRAQNVAGLSHVKDGKTTRLRTVHGLSRVRLLPLLVTTRGVFISASTDPPVVDRRDGPSVGRAVGIDSVGDVLLAATGPDRAPQIVAAARGADAGPAVEDGDRWGGRQRRRAGGRPGRPLGGAGHARGP